MFEQDVRRRQSRAVPAAIGIVACALIALAAAFLVSLLSPGPAPQASESASGDSSLASPQPEGAAQAVTLTISAPGADLLSCPAVVHISGTTDGNRSVDTYHATSAETFEVSLVPGGYAVEAVPMALEGGRVLAQSGAPASVVVAAGGEAQASVEMSQADADGMAGKIGSALSKAAERGDSTIAGDKARALAARAASYLGAD